MDRLSKSPAELGFLGVWSWDLVTGAMDATEDVRSLFQICDEEGGRRARIDDFEWRLHPGDLEWLKRERLRSFGPSGHGAVEFRVIDPHGDIRWVMCRAIYVRDAEGNVVSASGMMIDVTAFKADGNSCRTAPAPLADPLQTLIDLTLGAYEAAEQVGDRMLLSQLRNVLQGAGTLMARKIKQEH